MLLLMRLFFGFNFSKFISMYIVIIFIVNILIVMFCNIYIFINCLEEYKVSFIEIYFVVIFEDDLYEE